jgi:hypothetical protein
MNQVMAAADNCSPSAPVVQKAWVLEMGMTYQDYERLVAKIYDQMLRQDKVQNIVVEHNVIKQGLATEHQIDVYWEFRLGTVLHRVVVQAKNWAKPVDQGELFKFQEVLNDLGAPVGIMVAANGYQRGAREYALAKGITICEFAEEVKEPIVITDVGWAVVSIKGLRTAADGEPCAMIVDTVITTPQFAELKFDADRHSLGQAGIDIQTMSIQCQPRELQLVNTEQERFFTLRDIFSNWAKEVSQSGEVSAKKEFSFDEPTFLKAPAIPLTRVSRISGVVTLRTESVLREWKLQNVAMFILRNLVDGTEFRFAQFK